MKKHTWQAYKDVKVDGKVIAWDVYFEGSHAAALKFARGNGLLNVGYSIDAPMFDKYGWYIGEEIPADCVAECSASGDVTAAVEKWTAKLGFFNVPLDLARKYLDEFGAWEDLDVVGTWTLGQRILWSACCDISEERARGESDCEFAGLVH
jgi:hypothetical protein